MAIILSGNITVDESGNLQNANATPDIPEDSNDNDITVAAINDNDDTGDLPFAFESRLYELGISGVPANTALSGYSGAAGNTGADLITITNDYIDLAFTDAQGKPLGDPTNANAGSDWSGLYTLDGRKIFLYTDITNNIVLGRTGDEGATPAPEDDLANPDGTIVFAAYLEETATGAKVWMVQQEPLKHPNTSNPDDVVDMTDHLWVTASQDAAFDFAGLPSGENDFLMFKAGSSNVGLVVTGMDPDRVDAAGKDVGDNVSTSQGGGGTTIGTNNQAVNPGEGMIFTFVTDPNALYTVPNLTPTEANVEGNIDFGGLFGATGATFVIAQQTPPKASTARISVYTTDFEETTGYFEGLLDADDNLGYIASVTVRDANGDVIAGLDGVTTNTTVGNISVTFTLSNGGADRTATIAGFESNYSLEYTTSELHNRVMIENIGNAAQKLNSPFDIGGFHLPNIVAVPQEIGSQVNFEDDGPSATLATLAGTVDEDGVVEGTANAGPGDGIAGGTGDVTGEAVVASGTVSTLFASGADQPLSYSLTTNGLTALGLKSGGVTVTYAVAYDAVANTHTLTASAGVGNTVFTFSVHAATGAYTFTLVDQLDHASLDGLTGDNTENDLSIALGTAINATDADGDTVTAAANGLVITVDDDTPIATVATLAGTVDEDGVVEGTANAGPGDGIAGGTDDVTGEVVVASGTVSTLFQSGADEPLSYSLTTNGLTALGLKSGGVTVTYAVAYDAVANTHTLTASAGAGNTVFTFSVHAATGAYTFTLVDQLDHASLDNVAGDNTENDLSIALGTAINATDADGDTVTAAANGLVITVDDDTPIATVATLTGTVDEDGVVEGTANAGPGDGIAGGIDDVANQVVVASGTVSTLFQSGADEPLSYSLTTNGLTALGLKSGGVTVTYAVAYDAVANTHTLTASAGAGNTVFTFSVHAATGAYTFTLVDQLDHASLDGLTGDNTENDLSIALGTAINATDADGDTVTAAANGLVITVDDDTPIATVATLAGTVDEDGVVEGTANAGPGDGIAGGTDDVTGEVVVASGTVSTLFQSGADEPLSYSLTTNGLTALGLKSGGVTVTYAVAYDAVANTHTLTASAGAGNTVFTFSVHGESGAYTFTLVDQLDHASLDNVAGDNTENDLSIALGTAINATDFDGDTVTAAANGLVITVDDDTPIATVATLTGTVDEDGVVEGTANAGPGDGIAGGIDDVANQVVVASGTVSTLFQSGADEPLSYSLTTNGLTALGLKSGGVTVTYAVAYDAVANTHTLTASAGAGNTVFTFSVHAATGAYTFTLVDQLDHASLDGLTGDNTENDLSIALGTAINATDADGDTVTAAANGLVITVDDDTPIATVATLTGTVDEDGVVEGTANAGPGDGIAGGTDDVTGEAVVASGTVSTLFQSGADEPLSYSLTTNGLTALGLKSGGVTVTYAVAYDAVANTHTLTASAGAGNTVFTFSVHAATGAYTFTLVDQLDHASLDNVAGDNTENDLSIALGTAINATDADGDTVTAAANGLVITVDDDTPIATVATLTGTVDEDGVVEGTANAGPGDGIAGGIDDVANQVVVASGTVSTLFQSGADEPLSYSLTTNGLTALGLKSGGVTVTYAVAYDAVANTHTLTASAGAGNTVFTFSVHGESGAYTFTLVDQLDHASLDGLTGDNTENDLSIALGTAINATDADGDTVTAAANGLVITVDDDTPIATVATLTGTVDEDGVVEGTANAGPGDGIAGGIDDVANQVVVASGTVSTLFQSGADEPLSYSLTTNGLTALGLKSGGVTVTYAVAYDAVANTHTLTASAGAGNTVFTFSVHAATGAYTFTLVDQLDHASLDGLTGDNTENDLSIALGTAINATDADGDTVTAAANGLVITVDDDTPIATVATLTGTVDEDGVVEGEADAGRGDGIASGPGDVAGEAVTASGTVSTLFQSGADEALSYSLTTNGLTALGLKSGGVTVTYAVAYDADTKTHTLTASAPAGNTVFTFSVHGESGAYTFTLVDQLDHASLDGLTGDNTENDLSIALGTAINATDFDGDSVTAAGNGLVITVDDDSPVVTAKSNLVYANSSNPTPGGTGVFAYDIGADERLSYSATNADLSVSLTGVSVGTNDITNKSVTWFSENDTSAVFNIAFTYVSNNPTQGALTNATGTLTFNKVADTYTLSLTDEIESFSILRTSTAQGFTGYAINGTTPINQQPPVSVAELADDFFVQFTGFAEEGGGTGANNIKAGGDNIFVNDSDDGNELFSAATSWVSVSGTAAGVAGDTIQQGEVMDLDFFAANPFGITSATPTATSKGVFVKFDGIGNEDLVLVLKLIDPDDQSQITRAIIVDSQDIILKTASTSPNNFHPIANPAAYGIVLDQNDGAVIIESNDYNFGTTENYVIEGLQVLVSTEGVVGTGYNLNGNVGVNGASNGTSLAFGDVAGEGGKSNPLEAGEAASWDGDVVKIVDMGFVTSATPDALLTFDVVVTDADGDSTGTQTLNVTIDGDNGVGADTFNFSGLDTDVLLSGATDVISIGFVSGVDKLDFPTAGSGSNYAEELTPATNLAGFISAADTALNGTTDYYFGVVGGDGYLAFDGDGSGITNIIQLVGVTDIAFTDIV